MIDKRVLIGLAAGVAVLATVGLIVAKKKKSPKQKLIDKAEALNDTYRQKLSSLQKKAKREFRDAIGHGEEVTERVNDLVKKATASFQ